MIVRERAAQDLTSQQYSASKNVRKPSLLEVLLQLMTAGVDSQSPSAVQPAHSSSHAPVDAALCPAYLGITN